jgi:hypothetical protein
MDAREWPINSSTGREWNNLMGPHQRDSPDKQKNFMERFAETYNSIASTPEARMRRRVARWQGALFVGISLPIIFVFWMLKWAPVVLLVVGAAIYPAIMFAVPRAIKRNTRVIRQR